VKIFRFISKPLPIAQLRKLLLNLQKRLHKVDVDEVKLLLHDVVPDYSPYLVPKEQPLPAIASLEAFRRQAPLILPN